VSKAITREINAKNENKLACLAIASGHHLDLKSLTKVGKDRIKEMRRKQRTRKKSKLETLIEKEEQKENGS